MWLGRGIMTVGQGQYGSRRGCYVAAKLCSASANLASSKMLRYQPSGHSPLSDCLNDYKKSFLSFVLASWQVCRYIDSIAIVTLYIMQRRALKLDVASCYQGNMKTKSFRLRKVFCMWHATHCKTCRHSICYQCKRG